ncbi:fucolectin-1-like [Littorina saxatilis]|uniref:fucolectin-1-like n=1 Tax=Littorina saxatilis TaxID=31220 RepID=UPI0038B49826
MVSVTHNVAMRKNATQSSVHAGGPSFAVDGILDFPHSASCTATTNQTVSWWQVDLAEVFLVYYVRLASCVDCLGDTLKSFQTYVSRQPYSPTNIPVDQQCANITKSDGFGKGLLILINCGGFLEGQFVFLVTQAPYSLEFCEVQVFAHEIEGRSTEELSEMDT